MSKTITKLDVFDNYVKIVCEDENSKMIFKILVSDYISKIYRLNQELSQEEIEQLTSYHTYAYGFNRCMRKLASSDKSVKEIKQVLKGIDGLNQTQMDNIITSLQDLGYLKDENVCESQLYFDQSKLLGKKKTFYNLLNRGVDKEVVNEVLSTVDEDSEIENGVKKGQIYLRKLNDKSFKDKVFTLKNKLISDGFSDVDVIIEKLEIQKDEKQEYDLASKCFEKAKQKYCKKYKEKELYNAIYKYMASKGFTFETIKQAMQIKEGFNED